MTRSNSIARCCAIASPTGSMPSMSERVCGAIERPDANIYTTEVAPSCRIGGIFGILVTPFDDDKRVNEDDLCSLVDFCAAGGAHGIVTPVISSEFHTLSDKERHRVLEVTIGRVSHRMPVVAGVSGASPPDSLAFVREAVDLGADALIATPPYVSRLDADGIFAFYRTLHQIVPKRLPIVIQNAPPPLGTPLPPALIARIAREHERHWYVKQETLPSTHGVSALLSGPSHGLAGVLGGSASKYVLDELSRGAVGLMSACHLVDVQRRIYDHFVSNNEAAARALFAALLPIQTIWSHLGIRVAKEVLRRRGVIRSSAVREPCPPLDEHDIREIDWSLNVLGLGMGETKAPWGGGASERTHITP